MPEPAKPPTMLACLKHICTLPGVPLRQSPDGSQIVFDPTASLADSADGREGDQSKTDADESALASSQREGRSVAAGGVLRDAHASAERGTEEATDSHTMVRDARLFMEELLVSARRAAHAADGGDFSFLSIRSKFRDVLDIDCSVEEELQRLQHMLVQYVPSSPDRDRSRLLLYKLCQQLFRAEGLPVRLLRDGLIS